MSFIFSPHHFIGTFLVNNYKQAIEILDTEESLKYAMEQVGVTEDMLKSRIQEEKAYLNTLLKEPQEETDQMEYYQLLVNLADRKWVLMDSIRLSSSNCHCVHQGEV